MADALFSRADILEMRQLSEASLPETCDVQREVRVRAAGGAITRTWTTIITAPCRLSAGAPPQSEVLQADQLQAGGRWVLILPAETPISEAMRVVISGVSAAGEEWTRTLNVVAVAGPKTYEVHRRVICADLPLGTA